MYYWLKLDTRFFDSPAIRLIEAEDEGADTILANYLKMLLLAVPDGKIYMSNFRLSKRLGISEGCLTSILRVLKYYQLVHVDEDGTLCFEYIDKDTIHKSQELTGRDRNSYEYKTWRTSVFERDAFTCQRCGKRGVVLNAHHILHWRTHPDKRFDIDNGITLCEECHKKEHRSEKNGREKNVCENDN